MMTLNRRRPLVMLMIASMVLAFLTPIYRVQTYASSLPALDQIRVSLFIDSRGTVPAVTLSSTGPLVVGERGAGGSADWFTAPAGKKLRFSTNDYALKVLESSDYAAALSAYQQIASLGKPELFVIPGPGQSKYQVRLSGYRTADEAASARTLVPASLAGGGSLEVAGPHYASVGIFATLEEASGRQLALAQAGVSAVVSIHPNEAGTIVYSVWLGETANETALEKAKSDAAAAVPGMALHNVKGDLPYLIIRSDASLTAAGAADHTHYQFNRANQNVRISASDAPIQVVERYERSYRGEIEVTTYNGKLAVLNVLPFEQYLYSVVGSELGQAWPIEALKAQAVAARTYALKQGMKYGIAHISDTTFDQAYKGIGAEFAQAVAAVDATRSEAIVSSEGLILPYYSSNAGGRTAAVIEAWTTPTAYVKSVESPDASAEAGKPIWYRIMLPDGTSAYISSDFASISTQKNAAGLPYVEVSGENINIRRAPFVDNTANAAIRQVSTGDRFVWIGQVIESNAYSWIRGPYSAAELTSTINARSAVAIPGSLQTLEVSSRGPSERVTGVKANGTELELPNADTFRSALGGLPSTLFDIEEMAEYTVRGAGGRTETYYSTTGAVTLQSKEGTKALNLQEFYVMNGKGEIRVATSAPSFRFIGRGFGHGVGLSQYGAKTLADQGYDYKQIIQYYYDGVQIVKE